jgi:type IX secretion system PorP/SprF family membrane protein
LVCCICSKPLLAQTPSLQLMNLESRAYYNPAITGLYEKNPIEVFHRTQWANDYQKNYKLYGFQGQYGFKFNGKNKIGIGLNLYNEQQHITNNTTALIQAAYHLNTGDNSFLSFGVAMGIISRNINFKDAVIRDTDDDLIPSTKWTGRVGISWYHTNRGGGDISFNNINGFGENMTMDIGGRINTMAWCFEDIDLDLMPYCSILLSSDKQGIANQEFGSNLRFKHRVSEDASSAYWFGCGYSQSLIHNQSNYAVQSQSFSSFVGLQLVNITGSFIFQKHFATQNYFNFSNGNFQTVEVRLGYLLGVEKD